MVKQFKNQFGEAWQNMPKVMQTRYSLGDTAIHFIGTLGIEIAWLFRFFYPISGVLLPYNGQAVPVKVDMSPLEKRDGCQFNRTFLFPGKKPIPFNSRIELTDGGEVIEFLRFGIGWVHRYQWDGKKVVWLHRGFIWKLFSFSIPLPMQWVIGRCYAEEKPVDEGSFEILVKATHPWFGETFRYQGKMTIVETKA